MEKITVNGELLFTLKSKQDWVNRVPNILPEKIRGGETWLWVDKNGDVFEMDSLSFRCSKKKSGHCNGARKGRTDVFQALIAVSVKNLSTTQW